MYSAIELKTAFFKGLGIWPTAYLFKWSPTFKKPFNLSLIEVMRCDTDGGVVTLKSAQSPQAVLHLGHKIKSPGIYSLWEFIKVQLRIIR